MQTVIVIAIWLSILLSWVTISNLVARLEFVEQRAPIIQAKDFKGRYCEMCKGDKCIDCIVPESKNESND